MKASSVTTPLFSTRWHVREAHHKDLAMSAAQTSTVRLVSWPLLVGLLREGAFKIDFNDVL